MNPCDLITPSPRVQELERPYDKRHWIWQRSRARQIIIVVTLLTNGFTDTTTITSLTLIFKNMENRGKLTLRLYFCVIISSGLIGKHQVVINTENRFIVIGKLG